jgi:hypothetical protein
MPESPNDGSRATHKPLPQCKAFLICERVGVDSHTGRFHLFGVVNSLDVAEFPAGTPPLFVFLQLYDGIGRYELRVELRNLADDTHVTAEISSELDFPERLIKMELVLPIDSMRLPRAGRYEIALILDGDELATQFIDAEGANGQ